MRDLSKVITRAFHERIGWHKIGVAVGIVIVAIALTALFRLLRDIEIEKVFVALRATSLHEIILACGFIAVGYVTLTFYDYFSLRTIGRRNVPYRVAAMASFISYTIGHNLGATVFTGGAIRFRIYSAWGLGVVDVVKIAFVTGLTFWLGNAFVLGVGMLCVPEAASAINQLPSWINRAIALSGLRSSRAIWCGCCRSRAPSAAPGGGLRCRMHAIDPRPDRHRRAGPERRARSPCMSCCLPQPSIVFIVLLVTFVTATLLGFLSHAPGSLGVFEAAMLVALPQFQTGGAAGVAADLPRLVFHAAVLPCRAAAVRARMLAGDKNDGGCGRCPARSTPSPIAPMSARRLTAAVFRRVGGSRSGRRHALHLRPRIGRKIFERRPASLRCVQRSRIAPPVASLVLRPPLRTTSGAPPH